MAAIFDVVSCLEYIDAVVHIELALSFYGNIEEVVDEVQECVSCGFFVWQSRQLVALG